MMDWRIRKSGHGGFVAEYGSRHDGGVRIGVVGCTMPAFIVYEMAWFPTEKEAKKYIQRRQGVKR